MIIIKLINNNDSKNSNDNINKNNDDNKNNKNNNNDDNNNNNDINAPFCIAGGCSLTRRRGGTPDQSRATSRVGQC